MNRFIITIFAIFIVFFVQSSFFSNFYGIAPNLFLVLVILWLIQKNFQEGFIWAVAGGLLLDLLSPLAFGLISLSILLCAFLVSLIIQNASFSDNTFSRIGISIAACLIFNFILFSLSWLAFAFHLSKFAVPFTVSSLSLVLLNIVVNTIFVLILYKVMAWLKFLSLQKKPKNSF